MNQFLRRLRGILGTGLTWAIGWAGFFGGIGAILGANNVVEFALTYGIAGFIAGGSFAGILSITERRRRLEELSLGRVGLWGGLGGLLIAGGLIVYVGAGPEVWPYVVILALIGAGSSAGTVAIARRAEGKLMSGEDGSTPPGAVLLLSIPEPTQQLGQTLHRPSMSHRDPSRAL